jgi:peptidyl-prolyl cis-trans isomerase C
MIHASLRSLLFFTLLLTLLTACSRKEETTSPVLLRVDGREITLEQFRKEFSRSQPPEQKLSEEERKEMERAFLAQMIDRELALSEADRLGIVISPTELETAISETRSEYPPGAFETVLRERGTTLQEWSEGLQRNLLMEKIIAQTVYSRVSVSDEEIESYFAQSHAEFDRPDQVRARQIVVATEEEGKKVLGLLRQGEPFAEIARQYSMSPDSEEGGDLGFFARGEMPAEFDAVVFKLTPGRLSDLVKSEYGYHVFLVEEKRQAHQLTLDEARADIRQHLTHVKETSAHHQWLQDLRARASIEMNWELL